MVKGSVLESSRAKRVKPNKKNAMIKRANLSLLKWEAILAKNNAAIRAMKKCDD